jgi:hypothetical protein
MSGMDLLTLARRYWRDAALIGQAHYKAAERALRRHRSLGIPAVLLSAAVGTSIFATAQESPDPLWRIIVGVVALLAAALAALQTFLRYEETAEVHRAAGAGYGALRRDFDLFLARYSGRSPVPDGAEAELAQLSRRFSELAKDTPPIPGRSYKKALKEMKDATKTAPGTSLGDQLGR